MQITFLTRKFRNVERHLHCDIVHITTKWVSSLTLDCNGVFAIKAYRPLSRRLDRCDRVIQNESRDPFGGNVYYVTMQITFLTRKFRNGERNLHCDVVHITTKWVSSLSIDCNGVFAIKAYRFGDVHAFKNQLKNISSIKRLIRNAKRHISKRSLTNIKVI